MAKNSKVTKQKISASQGIKLCEDLLFSGHSRESILQKITKSYKISVGAIDKWIKQAKPEAEIRQKQAEITRVNQIEQANLEALKRGLKSDLELEVFLCQLVFGNVDVEEMVQGMTLTRDVSPVERLKAIDLLFKKRGSNAPSKMDLTTKGESIKQTVIKWGDKEITV